MFPLSAFALVAIGLTLCAALGAATMFRRRFRASVYLPVGIALGAALLAPCETYGCRPLVVAILSVAATVALAFGQVWGWLVAFVSERFAIPTVAGVPAILLPAIALSAAALERQYVRSECRDDVPVEMAGVAFEIEPDDDALFRWLPGGSGERSLRYALDRGAKDDTAALCRLAMRNGAVQPDRIDFAPPEPRICTGAACRTALAPSVSLETVFADDPHKPVAWFGDETRDDILWSGDVDDGWLCFLPRGSITWLNCTVWTTPTPGLRAEISADRPVDQPPDALISNLDQSLDAFLKRFRIVRGR